MILQKIKNHKTIVKNTGYLSIIEVIRMAMPFIALPYVLKTIGASNYGLAVFAQTIISYFSIFINFGLDVSAVKDVSINRNDPKTLNAIVSSVLLIKFVLFCLAFAVLLLGIAVIPFMHEYKTLFLAAFLTCLSEVLFPIWFYQGIEKMEFLTFIRTSSILFYTITVFIFVRQTDDYTNVVLLQSLGNLLAGGISAFCILKVAKIRLVFPQWDMLVTTFRESMLFFVSRLSVVLNNNMAKTISGMVFSMHFVAAFDLAQRIATVALVPAQMLNQAVYPHLAKTKNKIFANKFLYLNVLLSFCVSTVVYILAPYAIRYFSGTQLPEAVTLTRILCLWIFCGGITTYIGSPVLVSFGHPKQFNVSVLLSTAALFVCYGVLYLCNLMTIYNFALALFISECNILIYRLYYCYHYKIFSFHGRTPAAL